MRGDDTAMTEDEATRALAVLKMLSAPVHERPARPPRLHTYGVGPASQNEIPEIACHRCNRSYPSHVMKFSTSFPARKVLRWYCPRCLPGVLNRNLILCPSCKTRYTPRPGLIFCPSCPEACLSREVTRLNAELHRARGAGVDATLTLDAWLATLNYFHGLCAYCLRFPYKVMEHVVPVIAGGGTTPGNCVPACYHCNAHKRDYRVDDRFPAEVVSRITAYLAGVEVFWQIVPTEQSMTEWLCRVS